MSLLDRPTRTPLDPRLADFLNYSIYVVPAGVAGTTNRVVIGWQRPYTSQKAGRYAMQRMGGMNYCGLRRDGTWNKYGDAFPTDQEAFAALVACTFKDVYDRWDEQADIQRRPE